jgi:DTW domain-containing protein
MCLCRYLRPLPNRVGIHILQHPRESRHALGTTRLLRLGLASVHVHVLDLHGKRAKCNPVTLPEGAGLLYPSEDAQDLATLAVEERPAHLVLIDGTWAHANRIYRDNPWIAALPRYRLTPTEGSRYRIRSEPRLECLSTVESAVAALRCLQPDLLGTEMLDAAFDAMIDAQITASARPSNHVHTKRIRQRASWAVPDVLLAADAKIVVVYDEAAPRRTGDLGPKTPIRISAVSLGGAKIFDRMIQTHNAPSAREAGYMGLELHDFEPAQSLDEVMSDFRAFCEVCSQGAPLVLVSWGTWEQRWLKGSVGDAPSVLLKGVWANLSKARIPALDTLVDSLKLATPNLPLRGRAGRRLSHACAMARHILSGATDVP